MSKRILVVAEGERAEKRFLDSMKDAFGLDSSLCFLRGNIYLLYKNMKEMDFNTDVKSVLLEMHPEYRELLSGRFAYTYLVFDMDPHHSKREDARTIDELVHDNCRIIQEMAAYFTDETDPSIGKLYVNYPMLESFRSCDSVFDEQYRHELVKLEDIKYFKRYVATKKMVRKHLKDYDKNDFMQLAKQNVYKLKWMYLGEWDKMPYSEYLSRSQQTSILTAQMRMIDDDRCVAVLNTSLFLILDYYGNRDGFYDSLVS